MQRRVEEIPLRHGDDIPAVPPLLPRVQPVQEIADPARPPTFAQRVRRFPQTITANIDKKTAGYAAAIAMAYVFFTFGLKFYESDWLNIGQAEHRQLKGELVRPYLPRNRELNKLNWTYSESIDACYLVLQGQYNFISCYWSCFQAGGLPTSIHSPKENEYISGMMQQRGFGHSSRAWFGLAEIDGTWTHQDNSQIEYHNWDLNALNSNGKDFCAQMLYGGQWGRGECQEELKYCICKDYGVKCPPK